MTDDLIHVMLRIIEVKDRSTAAHTWRVALYSRAMAERFELPHDQVERITRAAALHDYGKIDIPDEILQKPGPLTSEERLVMQRHPALGHDRLIEMGETDPIALELVRHHHEQIDGNGYPDRLKGDEIPMVARLFSVIDSFDAMTSVRPYRTRIGDEAARAALEELRRHASTRYEPRAVEVFAELFASGELDWILHYYNDECPVPAFDHREAKRRPVVAAVKPQVTRVEVVNQRSAEATGASTSGSAGEASMG